MYIHIYIYYTVTNSVSFTLDKLDRVDGLLRLESSGVLFGLTET